MWSTEWVQGLIFPIYKTGDPLNSSNYRGIAITSCLSKLFNSIFNARLAKYTGKSNSFIRSLDLSKSFIEQNQCPNVSLNNQREITLILKRDKRKSISAEENKKKEVTEATKKLKNGKSSGSDSILNEMLKYDNFVLQPCLVKLFNIILSSGIYPTEWELF
jgi:hypothetical protein